MPFHEISIRRPSQSQLAKMKAGRPFRIYRGEGVRIVVDSDRLKDIGKKFLKDSAHTMQMTGNEIRKNIVHGNGIFGKHFDNALKKAGVKDAVYHVADHLKPLAHTAIDMGTAALTASQPELAPFALAGSALAHSYLDKPGEFQPKEMAKQAVAQQVNQAASPYMSTINGLNAEFGTNLGNVQNVATAQLNNSALNDTMARAMGVTKASQLIAPVLSQGLSGPQALNEIASVPTVLGAASTVGKHIASHHVKKGHGLYANMNGRGMFASLGTGLPHELIKHGARAYRGQGLHHHRHGKIYEKGSISAGGSIMNQQALSSQQYLQNFVSASFLPPAYQKFHTTVTDSRV